MYKLLFPFLFLAAISAKGQTTSVIGNWKFVDVSDTELNDSAQRASLHKMFKDLEINLKSDNQYAAMFFKKEEGTWSYDDSSKVLTLTSAKKDDKINIIAITDKNLTLELKKGVAIVMERKSPE